MRFVAALVCLVALGCNPVQRIALRATEIHAEAQALSDHGRAIGDAEVVDKSAKIIELVADIHSTLPDVEAKVPAWMSMLIYMAWAALAIAVCVILWQTGIGMAIKRLLGWIPAPIQREATLLRDVMDPNRKEDVREFVAARRASSPLFELAWKRAQEQAPATQATAT